MPLLRLDIALVKRQLAPTRTKAQSMIRGERVLVNARVNTKPGALISETDLIHVLPSTTDMWVGRGGVKLAHAIEQFDLDVRGKVCADIGASTGGFTEVLLRAGATRVYAIDVGSGQLASALRADRRVVVRENVNARYLTSTSFPEKIEFVAVDVSFISLTLILPAVATLLDGELVALIKPQFEVGRVYLGKGGIVRESEHRAAAVDAVVACARQLGFDVRSIIESPITGKQGNTEYLLYARR